MSHCILLILGSEAFAKAVALQLQSRVQVGLHANIDSFLDQSDCDRSLSSDFLCQSESSLLLFILHYICWIATRFGSQSKICENQEINLKQCLYSSFFVKYGYIE